MKSNGKKKRVKNPQAKLRQEPTLEVIQNV